MVQFFKPKPKTINKKHQEILITKMDYQGIGIGQLGKLTTFIPGVLPGEKAVVQITQQKKNYAKAKLIKRLSSSEQRIDAFCPYFSRCGGCALQHLSHQAQLEVKEKGLTTLLQRAISTLDGNTLNENLRVQRILADPMHYRRSARLSIFKGKIGFRETASKHIVDIETCPVLAKPLDALLPEIRTLLLAMKTPLGHLELILADNTIVLYLRANKALTDKEKLALEEWCKQRSVSGYLAHTSDKLEHLCGESPFYEIDGLKVYFEPKDFIQVNARVNDAMVKQALEWLEVDTQDRVLDLFCGIGNFSLPLAKYAKQVVGVEGINAMVDRALKNAQLNGLNNVHFYQANLEESIASKPWAEAGFNKVLLDPARAGAADVLPHIAQIEPQKIVYVSCNPATLASDTKILVEKGYQVQKIGILDMFPHTGHVESMLLFAK